jgi:hypothetical protein
MAPKFHSKANSNKVPEPASSCSPGTACQNGFGFCTCMGHSHGNTEVCQMNNDLA